MRIVAQFASGITEATPVQMLSAWGDGLSSLLAFMAQISLTLLSAYALAHTDAVGRGLARLGALTRSAVQAYVLVVIIAGAVSLILWALGLIAQWFAQFAKATEKDFKSVPLNSAFLEVPYMQSLNYETCDGRLK